MATDKHPSVTRRHGALVLQRQSSLSARAGGLKGSGLARGLDSYPLGRALREHACSASGLQRVVLFGDATRAGSVGCTVGVGGASPCAETESVPSESDPMEGAFGVAEACADGAMRGFTLSIGDSSFEWRPEPQLVGYPSLASGLARRSCLAMGASALPPSKSAAAQRSLLQQEESVLVEHCR